LLTASFNDCVSHGMVIKIAVQVAGLRLNLSRVPAFVLGLPDPSSN
jgi:hypothetical protein